MKHNVGIVGCGLIGNKRAQALKNFPDSKLVLVCDVNEKRAKEMAAEYGCEAETDWKKVIDSEAIDIVFVCTVHSLLPKIAEDAIAHGKHVLVEKPGAASLADMEKLVETFKKNDVKVKVGFNHRFHPAMQKAKEIIERGDIGDVMFIRGRYGHGGRLGYEKEWRAFKKTAGGGELLDQGSHLIDLTRFFMGDVKEIAGYYDTMFWDMEVEDNCFIFLKSDTKIAQLHASWTQWKNIFSMEIFCRTGQINIDGLGRSYGKETLTFYKMKPEMGIPDKEVFAWDEDHSWEKEYENFIEAIDNNKPMSGNLYDALETMKVVHQIYSGGKNGNLFGHGKH